MSGPGPPSSGGASAPPSVALVVAAFAAIYVIWGSTYLAILIAIESIPPLFMAAVRFLVAGVLLYGWATLRRGARPSAEHWRAAAVAGALMIGLGSGSVALAEQWIPSGLTAVLVASVPLFLVVFDTLFWSKSQPTGREQAGMVVGFVGVVILAGAPGIEEGGTAALLGVVLLLGGCAGWAAGSLYQRHVAAPSDPLIWVAMQMLAGGAVLSLGSLILGELPDVRLGEVTPRSFVALAYLITFGSVVGYSAYVWLLRVVTPSRVGTYAYVNPVIALALGWVLADEPISLRSIVAAAVILGSVVVIVVERKFLGIRGGRVRQARR